MARRTYYSCPVSGWERSSIFSPYQQYSSAGFQSVEESLGVNNAKLNGRWSGGGPWTMVRHTKDWIPNDKVASWTTIGGQNLGFGTVRLESPTDGTLDLPEYSVPSDLALNAYGSTAISITEPTNPSFDLSVYLGELRAEGLPKMPGTEVIEKTKAAKAAGGEFLNIEYGWLPLLSGLRDFAKTVESSDKVISHYQRDANHVIHRSYEWPIKLENSARACSYSMYPPVGFFTGGGRQVSVMQRMWFEVDYIYYLPIGRGQRDKIARYASYARKLYGIDISPEVLWNLSPWSWAVDWFTNIGDVMHNISALGTDGLVMQNGYIMCHTRKEITSSGSFNGVAQISREVVESKIRRVATPYGFGVNPESLSGTQIAILAALGLSMTR